jgi:hypothetical protein
MAGRRFSAFSIDMAAGDAWLEPHETLQTHGWLDFAGVPAATVPVISTEQQFAEKLHAYTRHRAHENSRVKDLIDMVLIVTKQRMSEAKVVEAAQATFSRRGDSEYPPRFSAPPDSWQATYARLAGQCGAPETAADAASVVRDYCVGVGIAQD